MLKNIFFISCALFALAVSPAVHAIDANEGASYQDGPAENLPALLTPTEITPVEAETPMHAVTDEAVPVRVDMPSEITSQRPREDNHKDYRYCLERATNAEISECVYKNR